MFDARWSSWFADVRRDLRHAARLLRRHPVVTMVATLSLAIGIGANTTVFTVASALLWQPPAGVLEPERLVDIGRTHQGRGFGPASYPTFLDLQRRITTVDVYACSRFPSAISVSAAGGRAESAWASAVTVDYFRILGATPALGRLFGAGDSDAPGASPIAVLSHRFWVRRFNGDPGVVGRSLVLNRRSFTVVGVASEGFNGPGVRALDLWTPMGMAATVTSSGASILSDRSASSWLIGGRVKGGAPIDRAAAEIDAIGRALALEHAELREAGLRAMPASPIPGSRGPMVAFVMLLTTMVSCVLVIACANVAGVLLSRAAARRQEMALRLAIGAGRGRLARQLLTETVVLFAVGGSAGLLMAQACIAVLAARLPALPFPVALSLGLDGRVVGFTAGLSFVAALASGLAPALHAAKTDVLAGLRQQAGRVGRLRLRHAFVIVQVTFSMVLIVGAGLFARALYRAGSIDPGFESHGVELLSLNLAQAGYTDVTGPRFARMLLDRVRQLPAVQSATMAVSLPGGFEVWRQSLRVPGAAPAAAEAATQVDWNVVEPAFFATLRTPILAGREFTDADRTGGQDVAIVSDAAARQFWPGRQAVGQTLLQPTTGPQGASGPTRTLLVVGVARDIQSSSLLDGLGRAAVYVPLQQQYGGTMTLAVRSRRDQRLADELRAVVAAMNPNLAVSSTQTLDEAVAFGLTPQRVAGTVAGSLGFVGLGLAALGIYGVMAYAVTRRTREIGIRVALGARRVDIVRMILREGVGLAAIGSLIGLGLASLVSRVLGAFLFGISPSDPITFGGVTLLFALIALAASYIPARRATRLDPTDALRHE